MTVQGQIGVTNLRSSVPPKLLLGEPLHVARARAKLRYLTHVCDAAGGHGPTAAEVLGIERSHFSHHITASLCALRRHGRTFTGRLPRFNRGRKVRNERALKRCRPLREYLNRFDARQIERAIAKHGRKMDAAAALGITKSGLSNLLKRRQSFAPASRDATPNVTSSLLRFFQVPEPLLKKPGAQAWWRHEPWTIQEALSEARAGYRRMIRQSHPDRGGSHEAAVKLTLAWQRLEKIAARNGYGDSEKTASASLRQESRNFR